MKNTIKAVTLTAVLAFGATASMAEGIIIGDRKEKTCVTQESNGIIIGDRAQSFFGKVLETLEGIIIGDTKEDAPCLDKEGIIIGDRNGIIIGD